MKKDNDDFDFADDVRSQDKPLYDHSLSTRGTSGGEYEEAFNLRPQESTRGTTVFNSQMTRSAIPRNLQDEDEDQVRPEDVDDYDHEQYLDEYQRRDQERMARANQPRPAQPAARITEDELRNLMIRDGANGDHGMIFPEQYLDIYGMFSRRQDLQDELTHNIVFDFENVIHNHEADMPLLGPHTLSNGLTFWGCYAGGDWEQPVFFILYYDGEVIRGYTPLAGNVYNSLNMSAFGNGDNVDEDEPNLDIEYARQNGLLDQSLDAFDEYGAANFRFPEFDCDLIRQELLRHIPVR